MRKMAIGMLLWLFALVPSAVALEGVKEIVLIGADGSELTIGNVSFKQEGDATGFNVTLDDSKFTDHFLMMRPFSCIDGEKQTVCHLAYPYKTHKQITDTDLTDLEYALIFLRKKRSEHGINLWNGIYYGLTKDESGRIHGVLMEADMNMLGIPPDTDFTRPITDADLTKGDPQHHRFPTLEIR